MVTRRQMEVKPEAPKYLPSRWFLTGLLQSDAQVSSYRLASRPHMNTKPLRLFFRALHAYVTLGCFYHLLFHWTVRMRTVYHTGRCFFRDRAKLQLVAILSVVFNWRADEIGRIPPSKCDSNFNAMPKVVRLKFGHHYPEHCCTQSIT